MQGLTVGLFDGMTGALRVGAGVLKLPMEGHVSAELSKEGNRVLESNFPDSVQVGDVVNIDEEAVQQWVTKYSSVGVLGAGGPHGQGVSGLNAGGKGGVEGHLFVHVRRVYELVKVFRWCQVHYMMSSRWVKRTAQL
jgi:site-specific DNA-cytosine methylase